MSIEKELNVLEDSVNLIITRLNKIPKHSELSEVRQLIDEQLLELKQRITTIKQKLAIVQWNLDSIATES